MTSVPVIGKFYRVPHVFVLRGIVEDRWLIPILALFLPALRPVALVPDPASARLARELGAGRLLIAGESHFPLLEQTAWHGDLAILAGAAGAATLFDRLSPRGELLVVCPTPEVRAVAAALGGHVWLVLSGLPSADFSATSAVYAARSHLTTEPRRIDLGLTPEPMLREHARRRIVWREGPEVLSTADLCRDAEEGFRAVEIELARRSGLSCRLTHPHNLWLEDGALKVWFDGFQRRTTGFDPLRLEQLRGFTLGAILADDRARTLRHALANDAFFRTAPELRAAYVEAEDGGSLARAPYYALPPMQRLGWLHGQPSIRCLADFPPSRPVFRAGETYPLRCVTADFTSARTRPNLFGIEEDVTLHAKDMIVQIGDPGACQEFAEWSGRHVAGRNSADPRRRSLAELAAHFAIPEVPSIATLKPAEYQRNLAALDDMEARANARSGVTIFRWRMFQRDDLARFCLQPGGVFAWDKGGGKGLALYAIPTLYGARRTLIVAPEGLHAQIRQEWREKFGVEVRSVLSLAEVEADAELKATLYAHPETSTETSTLVAGSDMVAGSDPVAENPPLFWLTSYTALGYNGADEWPTGYTSDGEKVVSSKLLAQRARDGVIPGLGDVGIGEERGGIRCVLKPSLATVLQESFDCVLCDEAVRLKSTASFVSLGVRRMRPRHAVALTGTPVKNRLEDLFWLLHWTAGGAAKGNVRFPYPGNGAARERFAETFMVWEENHTRAAAKGRSSTRRLPRVCNLPQLWKTIGGLVLRRRKEDFGEELVTKTIVPVRVRPGVAQWAAYRRALAHPPTRTADGRPMDPVAAMLAQLNVLRQTALGGDAGLTPLLDATLRLIADRLAAGKQTMVASPFREFSLQLERRLAEAGVSHVRLDGDTSPAKRGPLAADFKAGKFAVLVAGQQAMGEGYSFENCDGLILPALHWAYDVNSQVEDRVHRLTSPSPVTIYVLTVAGTIAERLLDLYREKSESSALAIDGRLFGGSDEEEVSLGQLLRDAAARAHAETLDERTLEGEWPALRDRLRGTAGDRWRHVPVVKRDPRANLRQSSTAQLPPLPIFAALLGDPGARRLHQTRRAFAAYLAEHPRHPDWRAAWTAFRNLQPTPQAA